MISFRRSISRYFNPRSHEGSDYTRGSGALASANFNPRSHEGSDFVFSAFVSPLDISIHAPTKGATVVFCIKIAIHLFQSTLPRRERQDIFSVWTGIAQISIHAPTKGATGGMSVPTEYWDISIHAPTKGATLILVMIVEH